MTLQEFANKFCSKMFANTVLYANMEICKYIGKSLGLPCARYTTDIFFYKS